MRLLRSALPFGLFTAPVEVFAREVLFPFLAGVAGVAGLAGVLVGLRARRKR